MKACGLIVEYNPFHNGHVYHLESSKKKTNADCVVAVMSGNFLQRGEPAILDKWHRAEAALQTGVDLVVELPYVFAVQHADLFAKGAILTLDALQVDTVCFGSEQGDITPFHNAYSHFKQNEGNFTYQLQIGLKEGLSFPEASRRAYEQINLTTNELNLSQPNNILGFSYVKSIFDLKTSLKPETIQRTKSQYHDEEIENQIASATSIRREIISSKNLSEKAKSAIPLSTYHAFLTYLEKTSVLHHWEHYFTLLQHTVWTLDLETLRTIHGMEEGLEYRLKKTVNHAESFQHWMELLKTKRYTWTRLQRMFVHLLTMTTKLEMESIHMLKSIPYIRILGMNEKGRQYINERKKNLDIPLVSKLQQFDHPYLTIEERANHSYYLAVEAKKRARVKNRDIEAPIILN
ncbi:putative nucleotidyltransferase [Salirhabdus euzebyi]|uniref:tRNA(Met) cytidine acetate ligase n=1 Tax=Salirhabdus euzebyi TaxID=394506 RepID=A0A841Q9U9_9BACI|nr:nucleotidyltransferase [Salirhabdus euzebyi]MBB6455012.1 putative nucleotidyltransferase [Salirhabdus euzebyi]